LHIELNLNVEFQHISVYNVYIKVMCNGNVKKKERATFT